MKRDLKSFALQLLEEDAVIRIGAGFAARIGFPADTQWPYSKAGAETKIGEKRVHQLGDFKRLPVRVVENSKSKTAILRPRDRSIWKWVSHTFRFDRYLFAADLN